MIFGREKICFSSRNLNIFFKVILVTVPRKGHGYLKKATAFHGLIVRLNDQNSMELLLTGFGSVFFRTLIRILISMLKFYLTVV
jgi:hypothetical protein